MVVRTVHPMLSQEKQVLSRESVVKVKIHYDVQRRVKLQVHQMYPNESLGVMHQIDWTMVVTVVLSFLLLRGMI